MIYEQYDDTEYWINANINGGGGQSGGRGSIGYVAILEIFSFKLRRLVNGYHTSMRLHQG